MNYRIDYVAFPHRKFRYITMRGELYTIFNGAFVGFNMVNKNAIIMYQIGCRNKINYYAV